MNKTKMDKTKKAQLRAAIYATGSGLLKIAGLLGLVNQDWTQALLLLLSGIPDLALANVKVGGEKLSSTRKRKMKA